MSKEQSDGSTASYYELPKEASQLQDLISHRNMNAQIGEIFRACYRYGMVSHSDMLRDAKKMKFYAEAEIARLEKLEKNEKEHLMQCDNCDCAPCQCVPPKKPDKAIPYHCIHGTPLPYHCKHCDPID